MKSTIFNFNRKLVRLSFFVLCLISISSLYAQTAPKSTNITTINGKKYYLHKIAHAQSLYGIAKIYNVDVSTILAENPAAKKGLIVGQELKIPFDKSKETEETKPVAEVKTEVAPTPTVEPAKQDTPP